jgi:hypothetical protein
VRLGPTRFVVRDHGATLIRPARANEKARAHGRFLRPLRQLIESLNDTLKGQLDLERQGGRTDEGVFARVLQRLLALTRGRTEYAGKRQWGRPRFEKMAPR